jgi:TetR/AcrR family transcriptional regulator, transcriptional repressor of aconitase
VPKVSAQHRTAQEERFLDATRRICSRVGVEGATMDLIRQEAGASAGAVYRYYASRDELIQAAIATSMEQVEALVGAVGADPEITSPIEMLRSVLKGLTVFRHHIDGVDLFRVAIQGWAFSQTRPAARTALTESLQRQIVSFQAAAGRWVAAERAEAMATAMSGAMIGFAVQNAFGDVDVDVDRYCAGLVGVQ